MANSMTTTRESAITAAHPGVHMPAIDGALQTSPAYKAYSSMVAALSAAVLAEEALLAPAPDDDAHLRLVGASDAAVSSAKTAALSAATASILHRPDHALVFSARLISFGLGIENGTDREAFFPCLNETAQFLSAYDGPGGTESAVREAIDRAILLSDLLHGATAPATHTGLDAETNPDVNDPSMDCRLQTSRG